MRKYRIVPYPSDPESEQGNDPPPQELLRHDHRFSFARDGTQGIGVLSGSSVARAIALFAKSSLVTRSFVHAGAAREKLPHRRDRMRGRNRLPPEAMSVKVIASRHQHGPPAASQVVEAENTLP
jgi:hypothetical protein